MVLAQKPHQEHITDINDFVWRMCVSYRKLNAVTKPFQFPIPRCDAVIVILGCGADQCAHLNQMPGSLLPLPFWILFG